MTIYLSANDYPWGLLWLGLALATAGLAEQKNRSRWTWFLLGLFLGPLATALVVVWPRYGGVRSPKLDLLRSAADRYLLGAAIMLAVLFVSLGGVVLGIVAVTQAGGADAGVVQTDPPAWLLIVVFAGVLVLAAAAFWFFVTRQNRARALSRVLDARLERES
ncbi:hypothetical protein AS850_04255 [Frondihabitans sp. 762G35]|uniref:hypothetical protein n=1 Tax=Frondihabitans sp. 762G35 TaxID=1446794 RepID=UPI000D20C8B6|nr:hypothetical protein [Frondihabitans sp. 762G35]ARC56288.1 hypothetical protein AS850_04255 [Frondihabitans sp. 762G35]